MENGKAKNSATGGQIGGRAGGKGKQSLIAHPLFPAMVAIWFGALFGLGSLAIRPTLLESLVVASRIDLLVPAAAPPLGMTARILLALVLAGAGGLFGATVARRIARPRPEKRERSRNAGSVLGRQTPAAEMGRRRALTIPDAPPNDFEERAPLPGGAPQILNVRDVAFDDTGERADAHDMLTDASRHKPEAPAMPSQAMLSDETSTVQADTLDLSAFSYGETVDEARPGLRFAQPDQDAQDEATAAAPRFRIEPAQFTPTQQHNPVQHTPAQPVAPLEVSMRPFAPPSQVSPFSIRTAAAASPANASLDRLADGTAGEPVSDGYRADPEMLSRLSGGTVLARRLFDTPDSSAAESQGGEVDASHGVDAVMPALPDQAPADQSPDMPLGPMDQAEAATPVDPATTVEPQSVAPGAYPAAPITPATVLEEPDMPVTNFERPDTAATLRISSSNLGELSQVELLERLAMALRDRRGRRVEPVRTVTVAAPAPAAAPQTFEAPAAIPSEHPAPTDAAPFAPFAAAAAAPVTHVTPLARFAAPPASVDPVADQPASVMPAALRPVGFNAFDDEDDVVPAFIPPRHIAMAPAATAAAQPAFAPPVQTEIPAAEAAPEDWAPEDWPSADAEDEGTEESRALEDGYSSLLNLSRPVASRVQFVRIEEPEDTSAPVEPVVIFPGQQGGRAFGAPATLAATLAATPPVTPPVTGVEAALAPPPSGFVRPFDAPPTEFAPGMPKPAPAQDPEETERALRAALASLQRMSGAA